VIILDLSDITDSPAGTEFGEYDQSSDISEHAHISEATGVRAVGDGPWAPWETREVSDRCVDIF
jgi:hypothetical protein